MKRTLILIQFSVMNVTGKTISPIVVTVGVEDQLLPMEVDTGAAVSLISSTTKARLFPEHPLCETSTRLSTYTGDQMAVAGRMDVKVRYGPQEVTMPLYVVEGEGPSLLGREWLSKVKLDWKSIGMVSSAPRVTALLEKHPQVFQEGLGEMNTFEATPELGPRIEAKILQG